MKVLLTISLLLSIFFVINSQTIEVTYICDQTFNYCNNENIGIPEAPNVKKLKTLSICGSYSRLTFDSIQMVSGEEIQGTIYSPRYTYFKDYNSKQLFTLFRVGEGYLGYKGSVDLSTKNEWQIDREQTKEILGLKCFLATRRENRPPNCMEYVWFSEDLPYSDAPDLEHLGLPGLVLMYYTANRESYSYKATDIMIKDTCPFDEIPQYEQMKIDGAKISSLMMSGTTQIPYFMLDENTDVDTWLYFK